MSAVELVTADGRARLASDIGTIPDLYWALRGGGGNFGVALTSFSYPACTRSGRRLYGGHASPSRTPTCGRKLRHFA